tara:strand:- start:1901 stop:2242 length:342 start_codon:yes stop_codon:yes gene_type:complete
MIYIYMKKPNYILKKSNKKNKKFMIIMDDNMIHHFGDSRYKDYTIYSKELIPDDAYKKKLAYIARHKKNEDWTKTGIHTSGFWSRWVLWNEPTILNSIKDIEKRFNIKIKYIK